MKFSVPFRPVLFSLLTVSLSGLVQSAEVVVDPNSEVDVGPVTPYGETPEEAAAKRVVFEYLHMKNIQGKAIEAFEKYLSKDYCNHSHLSTKAAVACAGYDATVESWLSRYPTPNKPGDIIELPTIGSVNGEMVTMYGKGVDIFRVVDGKITDHWDASPPVEVTIPAHDDEWVQRMVEQTAEAVRKRDQQ